jgi:hypothetical protein
VAAAAAAWGDKTRRAVAAAPDRDQPIIASVTAGRDNSPACGRRTRVMQYLLGVVSLFVALLGMGAALAAMTLGVMFLMHKAAPWIQRQWPQLSFETHYGTFDFDNFQKKDFRELLLRLIAIYVGITMVLYMLEYLIVYRHIIYHWKVYLTILFFLQVGGICAGLHYLLKLDLFRLIVLTASSAIFCLFFEWLLQWSGLMI